MKAVVVYESLWGNTAAVARAVAEAIGPDVPALTTDEATPDRVAGADLIVAGAPVLGFRLATEEMRANVARDEGGSATPPDVDHPSLRGWLKALPKGSGFSAAFETRIWWSPRGSAGDISRALDRAGYRPIGENAKFIVKDKVGPLRDGELERARAWGTSLAAAVAEELVTV